MLAALLAALTALAAPPAAQRNPADAASVMLNFPQDVSALVWVKFFCDLRRLAIDEPSALQLEDRTLTLLSSDPVTVDASLMIYETALQAVGAKMVVEGNRARFEITAPPPSEPPLLVVVGVDGDIAKIAAALRQTAGAGAVIRTHPASRTLVMGGPTATVQALVQHLGEIERVPGR